MNGGYREKRRDEAHCIATHHSGEKWSLSAPLWLEEAPHLTLNYLCSVSNVGAASIMLEPVLFILLSLIAVFMW